MRIGYVVYDEKLQNYVGGRRYSYRRGSYPAVVGFQNARIFNRRQDAESVRKDGMVIRPVRIELVEE